MKIREGLVFKNDANLIGFVDVGDLNNSMKAFQAKLSGNDTEEAVADHMLTIMIQGIFIKLTFPLASFPTRGTCII